MNPSKKPASTLPYIGSRISLISKSDIRYEGTLYTIDPTEHTVSLSNVRSFGTEGRRQDGHEIPPSGDIYEYIIFRGSDIKDLRVVQSGSPQEEQQNKAPKTESRPEPKPEVKPQEVKSDVKTEPKPEVRVESKPSPKPEVRPDPPISESASFDPPRPQTEGDPTRSPTRGGYRHHRPGDFQRPAYTARPATDLQEDFDFTEANSHLQRTEVKSESEPKAYDKKRSFFDSITSSIGESRRETREEREMQRAVDSETFGLTNVEKAERELRSYSHRGRRGRGGRFRERRSYRNWHQHS